MSQKLKVAIIGAGRIGYVHAGSVNDNPNLELVYVVDPFEESAKKVTADFGGKVASDPVAVINSGEIDAVPGQFDCPRSPKPIPKFSTHLS